MSVIISIPFSRTRRECSGLGHPTVSVGLMEKVGKHTQKKMDWQATMFVPSFKTRKEQCGLAQRAAASVGSIILFHRPDFDCDKTALPYFIIH